MDIREQISGIEGVAANGTATINLPVGRRYKNLKLFATGVDGAAAALSAVNIVDGIQIIVGNVLMMDLTADQFRKIYLANEVLSAGSSLIDSEIPIPFAEPNRASVTDENITAYDTFGVSAMTVKIKIKTGVVTPAIAGEVAYDYIRSSFEGKPIMQPLKKYAVTVNASSGVYGITTIQPKNPVQRIWLDGAQNITNVEVIADSTKVFESPSAQNARFLADYGIRATDFKYPLVFDYNQQLFAGALEVRKDLVIRATSAAAQTITAIVEERMSRFE